MRASRERQPRAAALLGLSLVLTPLTVPAQVIHEESFDAGAGSLLYVDDAFRGTSAPDRADGVHLPDGGRSGGGLQVTVGGDVGSGEAWAVSGGWQLDFTLAEAAALELELWFELQTMAADQAQLLVDLDDELLGHGGIDRVLTMSSHFPTGTGWRRLLLDLGELAPGAHRLRVGAHLSPHDPDRSSIATCRLDDLVLRHAASPTVSPSASLLVSRLDLGRFRGNVEGLTALGCRDRADPGNALAVDWLIGQLQSWGYEVELHRFESSGHLLDNVIATKVGRSRPDEAYLVSAHLDTVEGTVGADDDASGCSLVLEAARVFAPDSVITERSLRFVFWNAEEHPQRGSFAYVSDRADRQGVEDPPFSGRYPEPRWLGMVQADMILYDHGPVARPEPWPDADLDIEYRLNAEEIGASYDLATALFRASQQHADAHPGTVGYRMSNTDSVAFQDHCAAVSLREQPRAVGNNPHVHGPTDAPESYVDEDWIFGFDFVRTLVGAMAELVGATVVEPELLLHLRGQDTIEWTSTPEASRFNLYRGDLAELRSDGRYTQEPGSNPLARAWCGLDRPSASDGDTLTPGDAAFYLVTSVDGGGESGLGVDSRATPRPHESPCP
ncbi:MAG: M28 family peptidase [Acidobacteriota bacterium]